MKYFPNSNFAKFHFLYYLKPKRYNRPISSEVFTKGFCASLVTDLKSKFEIFVSLITSLKSKC